MNEQIPSPEGETSILDSLAENIILSSRTETV